MTRDFAHPLESIRITRQLVGGTNVAPPARRARPQDAGPPYVTRGRSLGAATPKSAIAPEDEGQTLLISGPALVFRQLHFFLDRIPALALARGRLDLG